MAPIDRSDVSSLSDEQLSDLLREHGVDVGPINVATRRTYESYLLKLRDGQVSSNYEPVDDDEGEDEEVVLNFSSKREYQTTPQTRQRREVQETHIPTPRGDSLGRPPLTSARKTTSAPFTPSARPTQSSSSQQQQQQQSSGGGIPAWVLLTAVLVVLVLGYFIYTNMEPNAVSKIPSLPNKVEV